MLTVIYSDEFLDHDNGSFHPEKPERLTAIMEALKATSWSDRIDWRLPTPVNQRDPLSWVKQIHDPDYVDLVQKIAAHGGGMLDPDTPVSPRSYDVALLAVNAWFDAVDLVLAEPQCDRQVFVAARPPGHHATRHTGMGFCLFSNAAIAAHYALTLPGIHSVAILDWDVHHGNGTQNIVEDNPHIAYCSLHQLPAYPGTGRASDRGHYDNILNCPMPPGSTFKDYQPVFINRVIPFIRQFQPDLLIISAGYDANHDDPLASIDLYPQDFGFFTKYCLQVTRKIVFGLEGGYDLQALSQSVVATVEACLG